MPLFATDINVAEEGNYNIAVRQDLADLILPKSAYPNNNETHVGEIELAPCQNQLKSIQTVESLSKDSINKTIVGSSEKMKSGSNGQEFPTTSSANNGYPNILPCHFETYPQGFPRLAAFQNSSSDLGIFRRFGRGHCRVLMHLQCEITSIIKELDELDISDSDEEKGMLYRLRRNEWYDGLDTAQRDLLESLQKKLTIYDDLLLKDRGLRALQSPRPQHYQSLFNWILGCKPLDGGQYDFLFHRDDFIAGTANDNYSRFDEIIETGLNCWPSSEIFQKLLERTEEVSETSGNRVYTFSRSKAAIAAKLLALTVAFTLLLIPVFLLYLAQMSDGARAGMVLVFVLAFGILMSLFVRAKVETVFVGTCTYCALLVTFLGNVQVSTSL